jgi:2-polyprenyl-3-methyl-5-hydroxy-6-metoxy-1,4-benzoquinol methylase
MTAQEPKKHAFVRELLGRSDYAIIGDIVEPHAKVLDLGCGDGELLQWLAQNKGVEARGVELSGERVQRAIGHCGLSEFRPLAHAAIHAAQRPRAAHQSVSSRVV